MNWVMLLSACCISGWTAWLYRETQAILILQLSELVAWAVIAISYGAVLYGVWQKVRDGESLKTTAEIEAGHIGRLGAHTPAIPEWLLRAVSVILTAFFLFSEMYWAAAACFLQLKECLQVAAHFSQAAMQRLISSK